MSYTSLLFFENGVQSKEVEYRNSWGGSAMIFAALYDKYCKDPDNPYDSWLGIKNSEKLWALQSDDRLPLFEKAVLCFTFDLFYVGKEHFADIVVHMGEFLKANPVPDGHVNHLPAWIQAIRDSDAEAVAVYGTSVSENLWNRYDGDSDEMKLTPLSEGHELYEFLASNK